MILIDLQNLTSLNQELSLKLNFSKLVSNLFQHVFTDFQPWLTFTKITSTTLPPILKSSPISIQRITHNSPSGPNHPVTTHRLSHHLIPTRLKKKSPTETCPCACRNVPSSPFPRALPVTLYMSIYLSIHSHTYIYI